MNSSVVMVKFQMGQFKTLKLIFYKIRGQSSPVFEIIRDLNIINTQINTCFEGKFEGKIQNASKVIVFTRNHTDADDFADDGNADDKTKHKKFPGET